MATRAQDYRSSEQRAARGRKPKRQPGRKRRHAGRRNPGFGVETMDRNFNRKAGARGGAVLEESGDGRPSRKSTRASIDHTKRTNAQELRAQMRTHAPSSRAKARRH
jgi:hypothetical protein